MKTVLLTSIGSISADIVIKKLKKMHFKIIGTDIYAKEYIVDALNVSVFYQAPYIKDRTEFTKFIKNICIKEKINFIIPLTDLDVDYFNDNRDWFENKNITLFLSPKKTINLIRNKKEFQDFLLKKCPYINSIPTEYFSSINELKMDFPIICKPLNGRSSENFYIINSKDEYNFYQKKLSNIKTIIEPFIKGNIVVVEIIRQKAFNLSIAAVREECLRTKNGAGLSVKLYHDEKLENQSKKLAEELDINGSVNFEFIRTENGDYYILECNPRFSAGIEFTTLSQYDIVKNCIRCFTSKKIQKYKFKHIQYISRKWTEYITKTIK